MMRAAAFLFLLAGRSSESSIAVLDLSAPAPCTFTFSGDQSGSLSCEKIYLCFHGGANVFRLDEPTGLAELVFAVEGQFSAGRTYGAADLQSFSASLGGPRLFSDSYAAGNLVSGSTVTLTLTDVLANTDTCPGNGGTAHGTARVGMIEQLNDDGGAQSPGHLTLDATF